MTCTGSGTAVAGLYINIGTVTGKYKSTTVTDSDPSNYFGKVAPVATIDIKKSTNGEDANTPPGPQITVGSTVNWTYVVLNTGNVALTNIVVTDNKGVAVTCPYNSLVAGASMTCTGSGKAVLGQYSNIGTVTAKYCAEKNDNDRDHDGWGDKDGDRDGWGDDDRDHDGWRDDDRRP